MKLIYSKSELLYMYNGNIILLIKNLHMLRLIRCKRCGMFVRPIRIPIVKDIRYYVNDIDINNVCFDVIESGCPNCRSNLKES